MKTTLSKEIIVSKKNRTISVYGKNEKCLFGTMFGDEKELSILISALVKGEPVYNACKYRKIGFTRAVGFDVVFLD